MKIKGKTLSEIFEILNHKRDLKKILNSVDKTNFNLIKQKYKDASPYPGYSKYLDIEKWMNMDLWHANILNVHKQKNLNILDIGTGAGYFPFVCKYYGHTVKSMDLDIIPMFNELTDILDVNRTVFEIEEYKKLPEFDIKFDLITAFGVCFNNHLQTKFYKEEKAKVWDIEEWKFFINDVFENHLNTKGRIFLRLNGEGNGTFYTEELKNYFLSLGAKIDGERVLIEKNK